MISSFIQSHPFLTFFGLLLWQIPVMLSYTSLAQTRLQRTFILILTSFCGGFGGLVGAVINGQQQPAFHLAPYGCAVFLGLVSTLLLLAFILFTWLVQLLSFLLPVTAIFILVLLLCALLLILLLLALLR